MFISHTKYTQRKINGSTSFAIDNMHYVSFRIQNKRVYLGAVNFKTKDQKFSGTLSIFTPIPLMPKMCGLSISYMCMLKKMRECPTLTYIPFHELVVYYKILYVSILITDYLIGLAFWTFPIGLQYVAWSGTKREQIRHQLQWALGFSVNS